MNHIKNIGKLTVNGVRQLHLSPALKADAKEATPYSPRIKKLQAKFQVEDDVLVHLKGGTFDKVLYYTTASLTAVGVSMSVAYLFELAYTT